MQSAGPFPTAEGEGPEDLGVAALRSRVAELEAEVAALRAAGPRGGDEPWIAAERLQLALDAGAIIGTWVWEVREDRFTVDDRFTHTFGLDPALGQSGFTLEHAMASVHPDDIPELQEVIAQALALGGPYRHQYRVKDRDGVFRWIEANGRVEVSAEGEAVRFPGVLLDIEVRRAAEAERDRANALLTSVIDAVPGVVYAKGRDGRMLVANRGTAALIGLPPEEFLGKTDAEFLTHKEQARCVMENDQRIMESQVAEQIEEQVNFANGTPAIWLSSKAPLYDAKGQVMGLVGVSTDITARKSAESALAESEARFRTLADTMPQMIWSTRPDGYHEYFNARWHEFTGSRQDESAGDGWTMRIHPDDLSRTRVCWQHSLDTGDPYEIEYRLRRHDGAFRWALGRALPLRDDAGKIVRWFGSCTDIHDAKEAADILARSREELERLVEERTAALIAEIEERRRAEEAMRQGEKMQAIGQLTGGIAHDFNNVLQVVATGITILRMPTIPPERKERILDGIAQAARNAKELTSQLLSFARQQPLRPETFRINERLRSMIDLLGHSLGSRVRVETMLTPDLGAVHVDPAQLETALLNLAVNSRDAMPEGGTLMIETRAHAPAAPDTDPKREFIGLTIRDTGTGMTPEVLKRVFEPFFTTKPLGKGTGLGLAQVHGFIKQTGGDISIVSAPGKGTEVTLLLPRAAEPAASGETPPPDVSPVTAPAGRVVLVVDDNPDVATFVGALLGEQGYRVLKAGCAAEALAVLAGGTAIDIVFSDIMMPGDMNGLGLAAAIRRHHPDVAVLLATGYSGQVSELESANWFEVLNKPYRFEELTDALARALRRRGQIAAEEGSPEGRMRI